MNYDAVIVGSGPNGLAAAITLARAGRSVLVAEAGSTIGGGCRSAELTLPGFIHDICSAVHPMGYASPFFRSLPLGEHRLEWIDPEAALAHPLDSGDAVLLERSLDVTADGLGRDARAYRELIGPLVRDWDSLLDDFLLPLHFPRHILPFTRFGLKSLHSVRGIAGAAFAGERARAFFAGTGAHSILPVNRRGGAAYGLLLMAAGHVTGWPIAKGGSQAIIDALASYFTSLGGEVRTGLTVDSLSALPEARMYLLDTAPSQAATIAGDRLPDSYQKRLLAHRHGPGIFKIDWALDGPVPWKDARCLKAATVHVGGTFDEIAEAEDAIWKDRHPEKPLVLLAQQSLFDAARCPPGRQSAWAYCHVPNGSTFDMTAAVEAQVERFAPGFRDRIIARKTMNTAAMENYNANYVGGDIAGGLQNPFRLFARPLGRWRPYRTPAKGVYICSSSMPPGSGVHGMCGHLAAKRALQDFPD